MRCLLDTEAAYLVELGQVRGTVTRWLAVKLWLPLAREVTDSIIPGGTSFTTLGQVYALAIGDGSAQAADLWKPCVEPA